MSDSFPTTPDDSFPTPPVPQDASSDASSQPDGTVTAPIVYSDDFDPNQPAAVMVDCATGVTSISNASPEDVAEKAKQTAAYEAAQAAAAAARQADVDLVNASTDPVVMAIARLLSIAPRNY